MLSYSRSSRAILSSLRTPSVRKYWFLKKLSNFFSSLTFHFSFLVDILITFFSEVAYFKIRIITVWVARDGILNEKNHMNSKGFCSCNTSNSISLWIFRITCCSSLQLNIICSNEIETTIWTQFLFEFRLRKPFVAVACS